MGQIDEHPSPTLVERLFTYAYSGNPDYTKWAEAHNAAAAEDSRAFQSSMRDAQQISTREADVVRNAALGIAEARHELHLLHAEEDAINKSLPPNATKLGTQLDTGSPNGSPIRDLNTITVDGKSWGFLYRTDDGSLMIQRDAASVPTISHTEGFSLGGSAGASKDPFTLGVNGQYNASTTTTDPAQQPIARLTNIDRQLPDQALVRPMQDGSGSPLPGSHQLLPSRPHGHESDFDRHHAAPDKYLYMEPAYQASIDSQRQPVATVSSHNGQTTVELASSQDRSQSIGATRA
jgi:hypothetical protein